MLLIRYNEDKSGHGSTTINATVIAMYASSDCNHGND